MGLSCSKRWIGLLIDERLNFNEHIQRKMNKCYKIKGVINKLSSDLPRDALVSTFK